MEILLFRHGIAEDSSPHGDGARRLTKEGIEKTNEAARGLARIIDRPEVLFTSPLTRAVQTADILADALDVKPQTMPALASGSADAVLREVRKVEESFIILVGHEPMLGELGAMLCAGDGARFLEVKKAGALLIDTGGRAPAPGVATLVWMATPAMLRALK